IILMIVKRRSSVGTAGNLHAGFIGATDVRLHRLAEGRRFRNHPLGLTAVLQVLENTGRGGKRRNEITAAFFEQVDRFIVDERTVLDRIDAGAYGVLDAVRSD